MPPERLFSGATLLQHSIDAMTLRGGRGPAPVAGPSSSPKHHLFALPREIRDMIYAYYAVSDHPIKNPHPTYKNVGDEILSESMKLSLRATCRQAYAEILPDDVFNDSVFFFTSYEALYLFAADRRIPTPPIRHLDIDLDGPSPQGQALHRDSWRNLQFLRSCHPTGWRPILGLLESLRVRTCFTDATDLFLVRLLRDCLVQHISWDFSIRETTPSYPRLREISVSGLVCATSDKGTSLRQLSSCELVKTLCMLLQLAPGRPDDTEYAASKVRLRSTVDCDARPGGVYLATYDTLSDTWTVAVRSFDHHKTDDAHKRVLEPDSHLRTAGS